MLSGYRLYIDQTSSGGPVHAFQKPVAICFATGVMSIQKRAPFRRFPACRAGNLRIRVSYRNGFSQNSLSDFWFERVLHDQVDLNAQ